MKDFFKNKKGLSGVIVTLILVVISISAVGIVWYVVSNVIDESLEETSSCAGIYDQISINNRYTCFNSSSSELQFSISVEDVEVGGILVKISVSGSTASYVLSNVANTNFTGYAGGSTTMPSQNSGKTYILGGVSENPDLLELVPIVSGSQCSVSDTLSSIDDCSALA